MSFLLDTCVISNLRKDLPEEVKKWFLEKDDELFYISVVTLAEIEDGIAQLKASRKKTELLAWFYGETKDFDPIGVTIINPWAQ